MEKSRRITVDQVMAWEPCDYYTRERVEALWAGRESLSLREIAALDIPGKDVLWVICHAAPVRAARVAGAAKEAGWAAGEAAWEAAWEAAERAPWDAAHRAAWAARIAYTLDHLEGPHA
jgi:hypothetical protein